MFLYLCFYILSTFQLVYTRCLFELMTFNSLLKSFIRKVFKTLNRRWCYISLLKFERNNRPGRLHFRKLANCRLYSYVATLKKRRLYDINEFSCVMAHMLGYMKAEIEFAWIVLCWLNFPQFCAFILFFLECIHRVVKTSSWFSAFHHRQWSNDSTWNIW